MVAFSDDIEKCLEVLQQGGIILYPTDTIWGIGCDATNEKAVERIYQLKNRPGSRALIVLVSDERDVLKYVAHPDPMVFDYIKEQQTPTTVVFDGAIGLAENLIADDGSIAIRICKDEFCRHLIKRFRKPIVSTSANISGQETSSKFKEITQDIKDGVDYIVNHRQEEEKTGQASSIVRYKNGVIEKIR
jgi:L-threonylcarbamoyladenylate synthase